MTELTVEILLTMPPPLPHQSVKFSAINDDHDIKNLGHKKVVPKAISDKKLHESNNHEE